MTFDDIVAAIESPAGKAVIQEAKAQDRANEIAFRKQLVILPRFSRTQPDA